MKYGLDLTYRDGSNYKCSMFVTVDGEEYPAVKDLKPGQTEVHVDSIGLSITDIPLIQEYGYDEDDDHPFVEIDNVQPLTDEGKEMETYIGCDQPPTCPKCSTRTESLISDEERSIERCMSQRCGFIFMLVHEDEEEEEAEHG